MASKHLAETREETEVLLVRDPDIDALAGCPQIQRGALWVMGIRKCLEQLARLPSGPDDVSGFSKEKRLRMWTKNLFLHLVSAEESGITGYGNPPTEVLLHTAQDAPVTVAGVTADSTCEALICVGRAVLHSLEQAGRKPEIPSIRRIKSTVVTTTEPKLPDASLARVLDWLSRELSAPELDGLYGQAYSELRSAARIVSGVTLEREATLHKRQEELRAVMASDETLHDIVGYTLLAMYMLRVEDSSRGSIQDRIRLRVIELLEEAGHPNPSFSRPNHAKRIPGLRRLKLIEGEKGQTHRLTQKGIDWVEASGLLRLHKPRPK